MTEAAVTDIRPLAAVLVSAVTVVLILASHRYPNVRESWSVLAALTKFGIIASMVPGVLDGTEYQASLGEFVFDIEFSLRADALGMVFALLASFLWIFTAFYAAGYMRGLSEHNQTRFFAAFAASLSTAVGVAFAENLLTIFVFYELLSVATYPLVAHDETEEARTAGRKYLAYTFFGGGLLVLAGTALVFAMAGTTEFGQTAADLADANTALARAAFGLLAAGFGVKAALMPAHSWLPDAMVAPTPVSGLLHAVAVVKSGVFGIARLVLEVYNPELVGELGVGIVLAIVAAVTLTVASIIALRADRLKRRLAYSTISQLSYIVLGLGLAGPAAVAGAGLENVIRGGLLHIPAHAFMKLTLFFCAGIIHVETHTDYISEMDGIGKRMPLTMAAFAVAAAGMAGIPLVAGFVSKWFILIGAVEASQSVFAVVLLISGVLNIAYFWPIVYGAFFESHDSADSKPLVEGPFGGHLADGEPVPDGGDETAHEEGHHGGPGPGGWDRVGWTGGEGSWLMLGPILAIATGAVVLGVVPFEAVFLDLIESVVQGVAA
ncbi:multisubunit sodium/proton antiporter, MrpD subunit [Halovenus aranensis]|uniref:Multisubunit sodium/proton antiporter, MrpD subunit n=1 Tax=Halovenus aranensis TaxID=890420 RepID=A0A1G8TTD4_9EURY|nr:proton-conducting transporter membrane subunit [Halovenus aranensis]SDJ44743.1 multisubunit sodium/proton antiporter, MrpD subunit [Halovenus aranensis]